MGRMRGGRTGRRMPGWPAGMALLCEAAVYAAAAGMQEAARILLALAGGAAGFTVARGLRRARLRGEEPGRIEKEAEPGRAGTRGDGAQKSAGKPAAGFSPERADFGEELSMLRGRLDQARRTACRLRSQARQLESLAAEEEDGRRALCGELSRARAEAAAARREARRAAQEGARAEAERRALLRILEEERAGRFQERARAAFQANLLALRVQRCLERGDCLRFGLQAAGEGLRLLARQQALPAQNAPAAWTEAAGFSARGRAGMGAGDDRARDQEGDAGRTENASQTGWEHFRQPESSACLEPRQFASAANPPACSTGSPEAARRLLRLIDDLEEQLGELRRSAQGAGHIAGTTLRYTIE